MLCPRRFWPGLAGAFVPTPRGAGAGPRLSASHMFPGSTPSSWEPHSLPQKRGQSASDGPGIRQCSRVTGKLRFARATHRGVQSGRPHPRVWSLHPQLPGIPLSQRGNEWAIPSLRPIGACRGAKPLGYVAKPQTRNPKTVQRSAAGSLRVSLNPIFLFPQEWGNKGVEEILRSLLLTQPSRV